MKKRKPSTDNEKQTQTRIKQLIDEYCDGKQSVFSQKTKIPKGTVSHYVNGGNVPSDEYANKIASTFNVDILWLKGYDVDAYGRFKKYADAIRDMTVHNDMMFENVLDSAGYRLEQSEYAGKYIVSDFPDKTTESKRSVEVSGKELREFNKLITQYADLLAYKMFMSKGFE